MTNSSSTHTDATETGGYSTSISSRGTRPVDEHVPVDGYYSNGKSGSDRVQLRFVPLNRISAAFTDETANGVSTWCAERDGEGVFAVRYASNGETYEDRGVYAFESVVGVRTSVRLLYFESTNPLVNQQMSNLWVGPYAEAVCHATGDVVDAGKQRYTRN